MNPENETKQWWTPRRLMAAKVVTIGILTLLLMIPMMLIENLMNERERTAGDAVAEVGQKWSGEQTVLGPVLTIPRYTTQCSDESNRPERVREIVNILPESLDITGDVHTEELRRGIYEAVVYRSTMELRGTFVLPPELTLRPDDPNFPMSEAMLNLGLSDLRGISEPVSVEWDSTQTTFDPGIRHDQLLSSGVSCRVNVAPLAAGRTVAFRIRLALKGSESLYFAPVGKTTTIALRSNCRTPSFTGAFLPANRSVTDSGFVCDWKVMHLNRNYPQVLTGTDRQEALEESIFGVDVLQPVKRYQQSMRSVKYAILIIVLTFVVCFFVEVLQRRHIHPLQYLLVGLALSLFYSLLLSISEHTSFGRAYLIAAVMTVSLITCYMAGVLKLRRTAMAIGGLLAGLYVYVYVLIGMESYALLAGSVGLFVILAVIMYVSQKIDWGNGR